MGELAATLLAELRRPAGKALWLLQIAWWDGTRLYSSSGQSSRTDGFYEGLVSQWGDIREGGIDSENNLSEITFTVTLIDPDGSLRARLGQRQPILNTRCTLYLAGSESVPRADWSTRFSGYLVDISSPGRGSYSLTFRGLNVFSKKVVLNRVTLEDWPNAPENSVGAVVPYVWGRFSGAGFTPSGGALPCTYVDTVGFRYLVCEGRREVMQVYEGGVPIPYLTTGGNGFTVTYPIVRGRKVTVIDFASDQGSSSFTCDVVGPDSVGDGTGTILETPEYVIDQALRLLSPTGASIVATPLPVPDDLHAYAAFCLDSELTGVQLVGALAQSFGLYPYLRSDGLVAFGAEVDAIDSDLYAAPWFKFESDQVGEGGPEHAGLAPEVDASGQDMTSGQLVVYGKRPASGESIEVLTGSALSRAGSTAVDQVSAQMLACLFEAEPDQAGTLASWFEAWTMPHFEHGAAATGVERVEDLSGNGRIWQLVGTQTFLRGECNGLPALAFNGTSDYMLGPQGNLLASAASFCWFIVARVNSVGTDTGDTTVTNDAIIDLAQNTVGLYLRSSGNAIARNEDATPPDVTTKAWLASQYQIFCITHHGGDLYLGINDVRQLKMSSVASGNTVGLNASGALIGVPYNGGAVGTAFADIRVAAGVFFDSDIGQAGREIVLQILGQRYLRYPTEGLARAVGARREILRQNMRSKVSVSAGLESLDIAPLTQVNLSDPDAFGEGEQPWERRPYLIASRSTAPSTGEVRFELADAREAPTLWLSCRARNGDPERLPGLSLYPNIQMEIGPGVNGAPGDLAGDLHQMAVEAPETDQALLRLKRGRPSMVGGFFAPIGGWSTTSAVGFWVPGGLALVSKGLHATQRSSFASGTTGLTLTGGGITADTADLYLPTSLSGNSLKFVVTGGLDQVAAFPATAIDAPFSFLSIDYKADTGHFLETRLQRSGDSFYFNASTGAWQAGSVWNTVEAYAGHVAGRQIGRFFLRPLPQSGSFSMTIEVRLPGSHGNGATAHVYHVQVAYVNASSPDVDGYPLRSVTDSTTIAIPAISARLFNGPSGESRLIPLTHGTLLAHVVLLWGKDYMHGDHPLFELNLNSSGQHYLRAGLEYNGGSPRFAFRIRGGAAAEVASTVSLPAFQFGDVLRLACRWTSASSGELGLPALTATALAQKLPKFDRAGAQVAVAGTMARGTDATYVAPTSNQPSALLLGAHELGSAVGHLDGLIQDLMVTPFCLTDEEIANRG